MAALVRSLEAGFLMEQRQLIENGLITKSGAFRGRYIEDKVVDWIVVLVMHPRNL